MPRLYQIVACLATAAGLVSAAPSSTNVRRVANTLNERQVAAEAGKKDFQGIYWDDTVNDCTADQIWALVDASHDALFLVNELQPNWQYSAAFNRFFIRPSHVSAVGDWTGPGTSNQKFYDALLSNIKNVQKFPKESRINSQGKYPRSRKVGYTCKPKRGACKNPNVGVTATYDAGDGGFWISFCDRFWKANRHYALTNGNKKPPTELPFLYSKESMLVHEWMHCTNMGFIRGIDKPKDDPFAIEDIAHNADGITKVYGPDACHRYAWLNADKRVANSVNVKTVMNADNYAWFFAAYSFERRWNWSTDMKDWDIDNKRRRDAQETEPDVDDVDVLNDSAIDIKAPAQKIWNCNSLPSLFGLLFNDPTKIHCDYVGFDYTESLTASQSDFTSSGNCTLTKQCWTSDGITGNVSKDCACTCGSSKTSLSDPKCAGFAGTIPGKPASTPPAPPTPTNAASCPTSTLANNYPPGCKACPKGALLNTQAGNKCETSTVTKNGVSGVQTFCYCNDPCGSTKCDAMM